MFMIQKKQKKTMTNIRNVLNSRETILSFDLIKEVKNLNLRFFNKEIKNIDY